MLKLMPLYGYVSRVRVRVYLVPVPVALVGGARVSQEHGHEHPRRAPCAHHVAATASNAVGVHARLGGTLHARAVRHAPTPSGMEADEHASGRGWHEVWDDHGVCFLPRNDADVPLFLSLVSPYVYDDSPRRGRRRARACRSLWLSSRTCR